MKKVNKKILAARVLTVFTWIVILLSWDILTRFEVFSSILLPSPQRVWNTFFNILRDGYNGISLWLHLGASFGRMFMALGLAIVTAIPIGLLSGYSLRIRAIVNSVVEFYRPLPPLAYYTLLIIWLGIGDTSKIALLFLASFAPLYIACVSAVAKLNKDYIRSAKSLGADKQQIFFNIVLPGCMPEIFIGLRTAVGVSYTTLVSAEMVAAASGIGWMVLDASNLLKSDVIFVGIIIMGITGIAMDFILRRIEKKFVYWKSYV